MLAVPALVLGLVLFAQNADVQRSIPLEELELASGEFLPRYGEMPPWSAWNAQVNAMPWAALEGVGEALFLPSRGPGGWSWNDGLPTGSSASLGTLLVRTPGPEACAGSLYLPKANGRGFLRLHFRVPADAPRVDATVFQKAELRRLDALLGARVPGGAWFRHRRDELAAALGTAADAAPREPVFRPQADALELLSGGRALYENLQLERGLPASPAGEEGVALDSLTGITVKEHAWSPSGEVALDPLAELVPADQHALFFRSFEAFTRTLDEADRLGSFGLSSFEGRSSDARTRARYERQLCLELSGLARTFGPLVVESVALTGHDAYLRGGSDVALLLRARAPEALLAHVKERQAAAGAAPLEGVIEGTRWSGVRNVTRTISSYVAVLDSTVVIANSPLELERIVRTARGLEPSLATRGEYRFFRERYALADAGASAFLVLPDTAIRRWCGPRWRIGKARVTRAAAELAEESVRHVDALVAGVKEPRALGVDPAFADLGELSLTPEGVLSASFGTLGFLTPIAELPLERCTEREAALYTTWREGYERAWSNFFDPVGASLTVTEARTTLDLSVMPLIGDSQYADLRRLTHGRGLPAGSGDPHPESLLRFVMAIDPEWEELRVASSTLGTAAEKLGADPFSWLAGWLAVFADDGPFWDEFLEADDLDELLRADVLGQLPVAVAIGVSNPLKLALFLSGVRAFVDGTAPGMSVWKERVVGERRFVEVSSPGFGEPFALFYATTPSALFLSLNESTLLAAMEREEVRRNGSPPEAQVWDGAQVGLEVRARGLEILEELSSDRLADELRQASWNNLPILNAWKRRNPDLDPVALHHTVLGEQLECPGGGEYVWNAQWNTMESSVFGHPGEPRPGPRQPRAWDAIRAGRFALSFEDDGLRAHIELDRK